MAVAGLKLDTTPTYLIYDEQDRATDFPVRTKPTGKRYAGYAKRFRPYTEYLRYMSHLSNDINVPALQRSVIPNASVLVAKGGTGNCSNMTLDQCYEAGVDFPMFGHMFSQEGEGVVSLVPKADIVATNGGETANNAERHARFYEGILNTLPNSDYWFFGNYGSLYFSYSNESFSVEGGDVNALQSKFTDMYTSQAEAREAFKQFYPTYYDLGMHWHAHYYPRFLPIYGAEHSILHMLLIGKKAFPDRHGSLFFWPPVESVTGGAFSVNHKHGSKTTNPAGMLYSFEHAVLPNDTCRNIAFIAYMEVEAVTTFEDPVRHGEDPNIRTNGGTEFRPLVDQWVPAAGSPSTFPFKPSNTPNPYPRQYWSCFTAVMHGVDLGMQAVNFLGGTHTGYTEEFGKFRLNGGSWTVPRGDGADILYQRGTDTVVNGLTVSGAKPICRVYRGTGGNSAKRVVMFLDPDGPLGGERTLEVEIDGTIYDLGAYKARDLHVQYFTV